MKKRIQSRPKPTGRKPTEVLIESSGAVAPASCRSRRRFRIALLLFATLALLLVAFWLDSPSRLMQLQAKREISRFNYVAAAKWLDRSRALSNRNPETEMLAARVARRQGNTQDFQRYLQQARRLGADAGKVRLEELLAIAQSGAVQQCEEELIAHMVLPGSETDEISDAYANGLAAASRFEDAVSVLSAWTLDYPDDPRPHYRMGRLHEHSQRWQEAERSYLSAIELNEDFYPAWYALGRSYTMSRKMDQALEAYSRCLSSIRPHAAKIQIASCYRAKGESTLARAKLEEVLNDDVEVIYLSYRDFEESPEYFDAATQLADLQAESGDYQQAIVWYRKSLARNERDLVARYGLALSLRNLGQADTADQEFERVRVARKALERANALRDRIATDSNDLDARLELGELLLNHESERMGLFWIRSILTYSPDYVPAHKALSKYYRKLAEDSPEHSAIGYFHELAAAKGESEL